MGGRALVAGFGAAAQVFLAAALVEHWRRLTPRRGPRRKSPPARRRSPSNRRLAAAPASWPSPRRASAGEESSIRPPAERRGRASASPPRPAAKCARPGRATAPRRQRDSRGREPERGHACETATPAARRASDSLRSAATPPATSPARRPPRPLKRRREPRSAHGSHQDEASGPRAAQGRGLRRSRRARGLLCRAQRRAALDHGRWASPPGRKRSSPRSRMPATGASRPKPSTCRPLPICRRPPRRKPPTRSSSTLAVLKYARFARGGRLSPGKISDLFDQKPDLRRSQTVLDRDRGLARARRLSDVAAAEAGAVREPAPSADQGGCQRQGARAQAVGRSQPFSGSSSTWSGGAGCRPTSATTMSGTTFPPSPRASIKGGKSIYVEKVIVGQPKYATPIFSADMRSIVFNPDWTVPDTIKFEDLQPRLRQGSADGVPDISILRRTSCRSAIRATRSTPRRWIGSAPIFCNTPSPKSRDPTTCSACSNSIFPTGTPSTCTTRCSRSCSIKPSAR